MLETKDTLTCDGSEESVEPPLGTNVDVAPDDTFTVWIDGPPTYKSDPTNTSAAGDHTDAAEPTPLTSFPCPEPANDDTKPGSIGGGALAAASLAPPASLRSWVGLGKGRIAAGEVVPTT